jgi:sugar (pentulose or hexulose) kinase
MSTSAAASSLTLVFDLGTTYLKAVAFDENEAISAIARVPMTYDQPGPARFELPLERFHAMLPEALDRLDIDRAHVRRIAFSTQANTFACFDDKERPLTPLILWHDQRADASSLDPLAALPEFTRRTGLPQASAQSMPAKVRWLQEEHPDLWCRVRCVRFIGDELAFQLTGRFVTEPGYAALSGLLDIHQALWWPEACHAVGLTPDMLGHVVRPGTDLGLIATAAADALGLPPACRVFMGCLDQYAGAIGLRNTAPGSVSATLGTVLATLRCTQSPHPTEGVYVGPAWIPDRYFHMMFGQTAAGLIEHYRSNLADPPDFETLDRLASEATIPEDLFIEPVLHGATLEQSFTHVCAHHTPGQVTRAIYHCVARVLRQQIDTLCGKNRPDEIKLAGGGARSATWRNILSDHAGCPVVPAPYQEPTALGAARLPRLAADAAKPLGDSLDLSRQGPRSPHARRPEAP